MKWGYRRTFPRTALQSTALPKRIIESGRMLSVNTETAAANIATKDLRRDYRYNPVQKFDHAARQQVSSKRLSLGTFDGNKSVTSIRGATV
jgi:hypothetical protein